MHYGKAEVQEKKTEYLVKAGDEAFRSGASNEAMNFYMDAIRDLSPGKENSEDYYRYRDLENKIGFAQQAAGNNVEAIETFERIIEKYYGYRFPANELSEKIRGISNMIGFIYRVYFPYFNYKKEPDEEFNKYIRLLTQWGEALSTINPRRFILVSFSFLRRMLVYDLSKSVPGLSLFAECPAFFMWSGISLTISKKILDVTKKMGVENHPSSMVDYRYDLKMHDFHAGKLEEERDTDHVFNTGMRVGDFWPTTIYSVYSGYVNIELGHYQQFLKWAGRLEEISESFDNSHARAQMYRVLAVGNYKFRKIGETEEALEEGIPYTSKTGHFTPLLVLWTMKSRLHADRDEVDKAVKALSEADKLLEDKKIITNYHIHYLQAAAAVGFAKMRAGLAGGGLKKTDIQALFKIINRMIRLAGKMKVALVDAYCLKALVLWKLKKQHSAFRYFLLAVKAGQKYHCNLELSRVYFEAGRCLREPGAVKGMLMGISGSEYLLPARSMFEEMDLKEDLEEMERYMEG